MTTESQINQQIRDKKLARRRAIRIEHKEGIPVKMGRPVSLLLPDDRREVKNRKAREKYKAEREASQAARIAQGMSFMPAKPGRPKKLGIPAPKVKPTVKTYNRKSKPLKAERAIVIPKEQPGKVKVRLNSKTEVFVYPGYDIDQLRMKYGIKSF